jgi:hypothetical protein
MQAKETPKATLTLKLVSVQEKKERKKTTRLTAQPRMFSFLFFGGKYARSTAGSSVVAYLPFLYCVAAAYSFCDSLRSARFTEPATQTLRAK